VNVIAVLLGIVLSLMCLGSSLADFKKNPQVVESLTHLGVKPQHIPFLGIVKLIGVAGVIIGFWVKPIGVIAGAGLALYFVGAIFFHVRARDIAKNTFPALLLFVIALLQTLVTIAK
jgi:uncharacterized membrane protein YphA (DoxX/SURF4 family)